jgi:hypothetical protein
MLDAAVRADDDGMSKVPGFQHVAAPKLGHRNGLCHRTGLFHGCAIFRRRVFRQRADSR